MSINNSNISNYPNILSLNSKELIDWCNKRKKEMHLSNAKLAMLSNVPEGTIDRILTGKNPEFRYTTIQPLISILIGYQEDTPEDKTNDFYTDTIDGYKLIVENKTHIIDEYRQVYTQLRTNIDYLKKINAEKQETIDSLLEHTKWLQQLIDKKETKKSI